MYTLMRGVGSRRFACAEDSNVDELRSSTINKALDTNHSDVIVLSYVACIQQTLSVTTNMTDKISFHLLHHTALIYKF